MKGLSPHSIAGWPGLREGCPQRVYSESGCDRQTEGGREDRRRDTHDVPLPEAVLGAGEQQLLRDGGAVEAQLQAVERSRGGSAGVGAEQRRTAPPHASAAPTHAPPPHASPAGQSPLQGRSAKALHVV